MQRNSVNKVILVGRVGRDPESREAPSGVKIVNFSLATDNVRRTPSGERVSETEWHRILTFGKLAEYVAGYVRSGDVIYTEGRLQTRSWEDSNGKRHWRTEIIASNITTLQRRTRESEPAPASPAEETPPETDFPAEDDSDLPF